MNDRLKQNGIGDPLKWRDESDLAGELRSRMVRAERRFGASADDEPADTNSTFIYSPGGTSGFAKPQPVGQQTYIRSDVAVPSMEWREPIAAVSVKPKPRHLLTNYKSPMLLAQMLVAMLAIHFFYACVAAMMTFNGTAGTLFSASRLGSLQFYLTFITALTFAAWTYRLYKNLHSFGAHELSTKPIVAGAALCIPFVNLVMPYAVFGEIWKTSDPEIDAWDEVAVRHRDTDPVTTAWWASITLATVIAGFSTLVATFTHNYFYTPPVAVHGAYLISAMLGIAAVWRHSTRQDDKQYAIRGESETQLQEAV